MRYELSALRMVRDQADVAEQAARRCITKIVSSTWVDVVVDANGLPAWLGLTPGEAHDNQLCSVLLAGLPPQTIVLARSGPLMPTGSGSSSGSEGAWANIPPKKNRIEPHQLQPRSLPLTSWSSRFFNKIKQCRRIATRYDKAAANYLAFIRLASIRLPG